MLHSYKLVVCMFVICLIDACDDQIESCDKKLFFFFWFSIMLLNLYVGYSFSYIENPIQKWKKKWNYHFVFFALSLKSIKFSSSSSIVYVSVYGSISSSSNSFFFCWLPFILSTHQKQQQQQQQNQYYRHNDKKKQ